MTETMPMTSAEKIVLRHKTLHRQAINKTKTVYCHITFLPMHCKVELHTPTKQTLKQFDLACMQSSTFFLTKSPQHVNFSFPSFNSDIKLVPALYTVLIQNLIVLWNLTKKIINSYSSRNKYRWQVSNKINSSASLRDT